MKINYLAECPEFVTTLAYRLLVERRTITPELTFEMRAAKLQTHLNRDVLPIAWVAHEDQRLLGTAALRLDDLRGREELGPWLGGVYVVPEARRAGIGAALCRVVEEKAAALGFRELFLFTLDRQTWYEASGWTYYQSIDCRGFPGVIMQKQLEADNKDKKPGPVAVEKVSTDDHP